MIDVEKSYMAAAYDNEPVFFYLDFKCETCGQRYTDSSLNLSVFLYGVAYLIGKKSSYIGFTCLSCLKTNLLKSNNLQRLKQDLTFFMGPNGSQVFPELRYHSPVPFPPEQIPELKDFNIIPWEYPLCGDDHIHFHDSLNSYIFENPLLDEEFLCSYINDGNLPIGTLATVLWFRPDQIESLIKIENDYQIRIFPRYIHKMSWYERYDNFCWRYKLYQDYLAAQKKYSQETYLLLREVAKRENINLDNLIDENPGLINTEVIGHMEKQPSGSRE